MACSPRTVETDAARSYVTFTLDPAARFSDGKPVTADDVMFSWQLLRDHGRPNHRTYYSKVTKAEVVGERTRALRPRRQRRPRAAADPRADAGAAEARGRSRHVRGNLDGAADRQRTLCGRQGRSGQERDARRAIPTIGGATSPVNRGFWNFDEIRFDYYRDANSYHEAFKKGLFDVRNEDDPARWQTGYDFPALRDGRVVKETFTSGLPKPSFNFVFNTRRAIFADIRVREAIALLFDFEWVNHIDLLRPLPPQRELSSKAPSFPRAAAPADARERALLAPFPDAVRADVLDGTWAPPVTDGSGPRPRASCAARSTLLAAAGYELRGTELVERAQRQAVRLRDHGRTNRDEERLALLYAAQLKRAGIKAQVRLVDAVQYRSAAHRLRFRHDPEPLGPVAVARQRAGLLLELGRRRRQRQPQLHGRQKPGGRRA